MKKLLLFIILPFTFSKISTAQVLCTYCYDQNDTISANVNNLVLNGGFENTTCGFNSNSNSFCPNSGNYNCDIANWICTGGGFNTYTCFYDNTFTFVPEGIRAPYFGNSFCRACSPAVNDTSCLNNIDCIVSGIPSGYPLNNPPFGDSTGVSLEQTVTGLISGNTYVLEFWAGGENFGGSYYRNGLFAIDVGFGNTLLRDKPTVDITGIGTRYIIEFIATSASHTIKFTNWGHICSHCTELILDDVRLYTLTELDASVPHCTVGINNPDFQNEENIFPNPFTNELNVKTNNNELSEIIFYDIASRKLFQQTFINSVSVNTENFSKGIYFYEIKNKDGVMKKGKVVKE